MSKVAELKADIPNYGDGVIINVYSSVDDMNDDTYTNDYILVEAEYDGEYHKDCPIAVTYSNTNEAYLAYGTPWTLTDADGKTCYVMTEPYFSAECVVKYDTPNLSLCYDSGCTSTMLISPGGTITVYSARYIQEWSDSCGNFGTDTGDVVASDKVKDIVYTCRIYDSNLYYKFDSSDGTFTAENILTCEGGGVNTIAEITLSATINGILGSTTKAISMEYLDTVAFVDYTLWVYGDRSKGTLRSYNITPSYLWTALIPGVPYYIEGNKNFTILSYGTYEEAIEAGQINNQDPEAKTGDGYYVISMPDKGYQFFFYVDGITAIATAEVSADNRIDLSN